MLEIHHTKEGKTMLIAQMSDSHLVNYINLVLTKVEEAQDAMHQDTDATEYQKRLYGIQSITEEDAADITREALHKLYPYLAEALIRPDVAVIVQARLIGVIGRSSALPSGVVARPALPSRTQDNYDYIDWSVG